MKSLKYIASLAFVCTFALSAKALTFSDVDVDINSGAGEERYVLLSSDGTNSWSKTFDLLLDGYNPATMEIVNASVTFSFADDSSDAVYSEKEEKDGEGKKEGKGKKDDKGKKDKKGKKEKDDERDDEEGAQVTEEDEYASVTVGDSLLWGNFEVEGVHGNYFTLTAGLGSGNLLLLQDGIIDYSVEALSGDFYLKHASLTAEVRSLQVPDTGATVGMLGLGVAAMIILRRQMLKGKDA